MGLELHGGDRSHPHGAGLPFGAYKFPRELTWIVGVFLLLMTLGMAFSGQVLRFDQDAYWGLGIGASIASRVPIAGPSDREIDARWADYCRCDAVPIFRAACLRDSRNADRFRLSSSLDGAEAGNQRMADAGTPGQASNLREPNIIELTKKRWRAVRSLCGLERSVLRGFHPLGSRRMRGVLRSVRSDRPPGPDDHPDRAETGLLFPVALRRCCRYLPPSLETPALLIGPGRRDHRFCFFCHFSPAKGKRAGAGGPSRF